MEIFYKKLIKAINICYEEVKVTKTKQKCLCHSSCCFDKFTDSNRK